MHKECGYLIRGTVRLDGHLINHHERLGIIPKNYTFLLQSGTKIYVHSIVVENHANNPSFLAKFRGCLLLLNFPKQDKSKFYLTDYQGGI